LWRGGLWEGLESAGRTIFDGGGGDGRCDGRGGGWGGGGGGGTTAVRVS